MGTSLRGGLAVPAWEVEGADSDIPHSALGYTVYGSALYLYYGASFGFYSSGWFVALVPHAYVPLVRWPFMTS